MISEQTVLLELATLDTPTSERAVAAIRGLSEPPAGDAAQWPLPRCDARLLELHRARYGDDLLAVSACPRCGDQLELRFDIDDLLAAVGDPDPTELTLNLDGYEVELRLPTTADLRRAGSSGSASRAREELLDACVITCRHAGSTLRGPDLPASVRAAAEQRLERFDLAGEPVALECPSCGAPWSASLDVATLVLAEIDAEARRLLIDVHVLAGAYGWSEEQILALPVGRRNRYVEMVLE